MSGMTLQVVLAADAGSFAVAARQWQAMAGDLDNVAEDLIRGTRGLEDVWALGPASQAAHERAARLPSVSRLSEAGLAPETLS